MRVLDPRLMAGCLCALAAFVLAGCGTPVARAGIADPQLAAKAQIADMPGVRAWADEVPADPIAELRRRAPGLPRLAQSASTVDGRPLVETLALSGGGADGAFGAGLLAGWTARGDRPQFEIVTGVSAGAIIAPFAFLGPSEDDKLRRIWTEYQTNEIVITQFLPGLLGGDGLVDTAPLEKLIADYVTPEFLARIAQQYQRGRLLLVLTTNLDAQRPVVWNMGEIARQRTPQALELFRKVILASASIPGAFPPVNIPVKAGGKMYEEMHVDGGTTREVFVLPMQVPFSAFDGLYPMKPVRRLYLVKNGKLNPEQDIVNQKTLPIASRALATLIKTQNANDLYRIYRNARDAHATFNLVAVPPTFAFRTSKVYDPEYQKALYAEGVAAGRKGPGAWQHLPPSLRPPVLARAPAKTNAQAAASAR